MHMKLTKSLLIIALGCGTLCAQTQAPTDQTKNPPAKKPTPAAKNAPAPKAAAMKAPAASTKPGTPVPAASTKPGTPVPAAKANPPAGTKPATPAAGKPATTAGTPTMRGSAQPTPPPAKPTPKPMAVPVRIPAPAPKAPAPKPAVAPAKKPAPPVTKKAAVEAPKVVQQASAKEQTTRVSATGKMRDPFVSPVVRSAGGTGSGCDTGKRCLMVDQIILKGIVKAPSGFIAVVENPARRAYFMRENDPIFNGKVVKITGDTVVFEEQTTDKLGKQSMREVVKKVNAPVV